MCMLTYFAPGARPDTDALANGAVLNDDGHGFAIVTKRGLVIRHSMHAASLIDRFDALRRKYPDGPALFHSRMGTGGRTDRRNCHPFRLRGDRRTVIAHNGVFPRDVQPVGKDPRCDTRIAAENVFPYQFGPLHTDEARSRAEMWMGKWNKVVILTTNPAYSQSAYILNERAGVWVKDVWYSNYDFEDLSAYTEPTVKATATLLDSKCVFCGTDESVTPDNMCMVCDTCQDCGEEWVACQCYVPEKVKSTADTFASEYAGWWSEQLRKNGGDEW